MILKPFFRRHFWMVAFVFAFILSVATFLSRYLNHIERAESFKTQGRLYFNLIDRQTDKLEYVRQFNAIDEETAVPIDLDLVRDGKSLLNGEAREIPVATSLDERIYVHDINLPEPAKFVVTFNDVRYGPRRATQVTFAVMLIAIALASTLSVFLMYWSFRSRADMAKSILTRLQHGDLKARFPTSRLDEVGQLMTLFNHMGDEIERLVESVKSNEKQRIHLLQELTHDLRTPVSSLRNLIETLRFSEGKLDKKDQHELLDLAFQESEYLTRLVEDLLFLALVLEPKYKPENGDVAIKSLVQKQLSAASATYPEISSSLRETPAGREPMLNGSAHLMQRLFRNALENAFSFARSNVNVALSEGRGNLQICITDDGPGLNPSALESFGRKLTTRNQSERQAGRLSVGLGSVIIQAIANAHGGTVAIGNVLDKDGNVSGAQLVVNIPTERHRPPEI